MILKVKETLLVEAVEVRNESGVPCRIAYLPMKAVKFRSEGNSTEKQLIVVIRNEANTMDMARVVLVVEDDEEPKTAN